MTWLLAASISAFLAAGAALGQKLALRRSDPRMATFLVSVCVLLCSTWIPFTTAAFTFERTSFGIIVIKSVLDAAGFALMMKALAIGDLGATLPLLAVSPGVTALVAYATLGEKLAAIQWLGLGFMTCGSYFLEAVQSDKGRAPLRDLARSRQVRLLGVTLLMYAIASILGKVLVARHQTPPLAVVFWQNVLFVVFYGGALAVRGTASVRSLLAAPQPSWSLLLLVGALSVGYRYAQLWALQVGPVALVLAVKRTSVLYATAASGRFLGEPLVARRLGAGALIVAGGLIVAIAK